MDELKYRVIIDWSAEDAAYVARVPELPGCMAHGDTYQEAALEIETAMRLWICAAREFGRDAPAPRALAV